MFRNAPSCPLTEKFPQMQNRAACETSLNASFERRSWNLMREKSLHYVSQPVIALFYHDVTAFVCLCSAYSQMWISHGVEFSISGSTSNKCMCKSWCLMLINLTADTFCDHISWGCWTQDWKCFLCDSTG